MRIAGSARKHGVDDRDIDHAVRYPVRTALITDPETGEVRHLYIGADRTGQLLEIVIVRLFEDDPTVIHACPPDPSSFEVMHMSQLHTEIETWLDTVDPADLHDASDLRTIALAHDARPYGEEPVLAAVAAARLAGRTWAEIGLALGMSRQSAHGRFAARLDQAMVVRVQAALVERKGRQVIEAELKTERVPSDALFSMRISRQPFGFGHSRTGSMATGDLPRFDFPDSWHETQELKSGRYKVEGEIRLGGTIIHDAAYVDVE